MPIRHAQAVWEGKVASGKGTLGFGSYQGVYSYASRMESGEGTNPEELLGAAHAACFSMALALELGHLHATPLRISTRADVHFDKSGDSYAISAINLHCEATVAGVNREQFARATEQAKLTCPVSKALSGVEIQLDARLVPANPEARAA